MKAEFQVVDKVYRRIRMDVKASGAKSLFILPRVIYEVRSSSECLRKGGFRSYFENFLNPEESAKAYEFIGMITSAECFRLAESLMPPGYKNLPMPELDQVIDAKQELLETLAKNILSKEGEAIKRLAEAIEKHLL